MIRAARRSFNAPYTAAYPFHPSLGGYDRTRISRNGLERVVRLAAR